MGNFSYQDPFQDYKDRLAKKLARKAESAAGVKPKATPSDNLTWFGTRVGAAGAGKDGGAAGTSGVGKYLVTAGVKRPAEVVEPAAARTVEQQKKRRLGFGDFEGW